MVHRNAEYLWKELAAFHCNRICAVLRTAVHSYHCKPAKAVPCWHALIAVTPACCFMPTLEADTHGGELIMKLDLAIHDVHAIYFDLTKS